MYPPELQEQSEKLFQFHRDISGFYNELAKSMGLTLGSLSVLHTLLHEENCTQKTIVNLTYLPKQTVNAIIKSFKEKGIIAPLVESETDKRNKLLTFTEEGYKYASNVIDKAKAAEYHALDKLGPKKRALLVEIIEAYKNNLKTEDNTQ